MSSLSSRLPELAHEFGQKTNSARNGKCTVAKYLGVASGSIPRCRSAVRGHLVALRQTDRGSSQLTQALQNRVHVHNGCLHIWPECIALLRAPDRRHDETL
jgi:hypothetical protein